MVKKIFCAVFVLLILASFASAKDVPIAVKTLPFHNVSIIVQDPVTEIILNSQSKESDASGTASFTLTTDKNSVDISVQVKKNGKLIILNNGKRTYSEEDVSTSSSMAIDLLTTSTPTPSIPPVINTTNSSQETNTTNLTTSNDAIIEIYNDTEEQDSSTSDSNLSSQSITGEVISSTGSSFNIPKFVYYILIGVLAVAIIAFFVIKRMPLYHSIPSSGKSDNIRVIKSSEFLSQNREELSQNKEQFNQMEDTQLNEAEKKIKEAQDEINRIRERKSKMQEAERKYLESKAELERLKRE